MKDDRGLIQNPDRFRQPFDLTRMRWGNITPSDIDIIIEYRDRGYIIGDIKKEGNYLTLGQEIMYGRLVRDLNKTKPTLFFVAEHDIDDCDTPIPVHELLVDGVTVKDLCDKFIEEKLT